MERYFIYDCLINADDICNFKKNIDDLKKAVGKGQCVRLYGRRNFGKTSIVKNIIAPTWESVAPSKRIPIYIDLYSVQTTEDISREFTKSFNASMTRKIGLFKKGLDWLKMLKHVRPTWQPTTSNSDFGEFSIKAEKGSDIVDFEVVVDNINHMSRSGKFKFLLILDEFQEIANIRQAEAKLRASLQELDSDTPVVILGSKQHMLDKIFTHPRAPFHAWGTTIELRDIPYEEYFEYMRNRFERAGKTIDLTTSIYLQGLMGRIPESVNRLCDVIADLPGFKIITNARVDESLNALLERCLSVYSNQYANFAAGERKVMHALSRFDRARNLLSVDFLRLIDGISKSGVDLIIRRFLDRGIIYKEHMDDGNIEFFLADPMLKFYIRKYKTF